VTEQQTTDPRRIEWVPLDELVPDPANPKDHAHDLIDDSIRRHGVIDLITRDDRTGYIVSGHGRTTTLRAQRDRGEDPPEGVQVASDGTWLIPVTTGWASVDDLDARAALIGLNRTSEAGGWVDDSLITLLDQLSAADALAGVGYTADEIEALRTSLTAPPEPVGPGPTLADRFLVPPFTVLDARGGVWQERKRQWLALGIQSEVGRGETRPGEQGGGGGMMKTPVGARLGLGAVQTNLDGVDAARYGRSIKGQEDLTRIKPNLAGALAGDRTPAQGLQAHRDPATGELTYTETTAAGVSIFDPVLCELAYRWFSPPGATVLDPFAGGSVRGIVATALERAYVGVELRGEQVAANQAQLPLLDRFDPDVTRAMPVWHTGDSREVLPTLDLAADLVFSCPPYADLEVYSDDPADLSAMPYDDFLTAYRQIIASSVALLRDDRFAVWVIGEVRDRRGLYRGLVPDTIAAFVDAGAALYNEAILVTPVGSLPIRAGRQFATGRKLGKTHQNVLVFCKGDPRAAADACGTVEVQMPETTSTDT
jgi:hypothetical protein